MVDEAPQTKRFNLVSRTCGLMTTWVLAKGNSDNEIPVQPLSSSVKKVGKTLRPTFPLVSKKRSRSPSQHRSVPYPESPRSESESSSSYSSQSSAQALNKQWPSNSAWGSWPITVTPWPLCLLGPDAGSLHSATWPGPALCFHQQRVTGMNEDDGRNVDSKLQDRVENNSTSTDQNACQPENSNRPLRPDPACQVYCGNLTADKVTAQDLIAAFQIRFRALPAFEDLYPTSVETVRSAVIVRSTYAFVTFADGRLASTAIMMSGFHLCGRPIRIGRPKYYRADPSNELQPFDVGPLQRMGLLPLVQANRVSHQYSSAFPKASSKQFHLYCGNLLPGQEGLQELVELITCISMELPEYSVDLGPAMYNIVPARARSDGTSAWLVEFQSEALALAAQAALWHAVLGHRNLVVSLVTKDDARIPTGINL
jgi:hypothetical protein